jgi:hypothetical protein
MRLFSEHGSDSVLVDEPFHSGFPIVAYAVVAALFHANVILLQRHGGFQILIRHGLMMLVQVGVKQFYFSYIWRELPSPFDCKIHLILWALQLLSDVGEAE